MRYYLGSVEEGGEGASSSSGSSSKAGSGSGGGGKKVPSSLYAMVAALVAGGLAEWAALLPHLSPPLEEVGVVVVLWVGRGLLWVVLCFWGWGGRSMVWWVCGWWRCGCRCHVVVVVAAVVISRWALPTA
jgi:hypothetical protein